MEKIDFTSLWKNDKEKFLETVIDEVKAGEYCSISVQICCHSFAYLHQDTRYSQRSIRPSRLNYNSKEIYPLAIGQHIILSHCPRNNYRNIEGLNVDFALLIASIVINYGIPIYNLESKNHPLLEYCEKLESKNMFYEDLRILAHYGIDSSKSKMVVSDSVRKLQDRKKIGRGKNQFSEYIIDKLLQAYEISEL